VAEEYLTFDETVAKLGVSEDELLNMVSGNTLRAFRIDRETKFKLEDVEAVALGGGAASAPAEDIVALDSSDMFDIEEEPEIAAAPDSGDSGEIFEIDDLPDDIVMVDEGDSSELEVTADLTDASSDIIEPDESISMVELEQESSMVDFGDDSLEILEPDADSDIDSNSELEETVMTDSSSINNTEELSVDEDDFDFSTQEVTVQEDAITEDEIGGDPTVVGYDDDEGEVAEEEEEFEDEGYSPASARRSRRSRTFDKEPKIQTDVVWTGAMAVLLVLMIYPTLMFGYLLFHGYTTGMSAIPVGEQRYDGEVQNISPIFVPSMFKWIPESVHGFLGERTYGKGQTGYVPFQQRIDSGQLKLDEPNAGGAATSESAAPANE